MKETQKQLNKLIRDLYGESEAVQIARDIEEADAMMASLKTPALRAEAIGQIKRRMLNRSAAMHRKPVLLRTVLTTAAACLLIGAGLLWYMDQRQPVQPPAVITQTVVVSEFFSDETNMEFASDLDEISDQLYAVESSGWDNPWEEELETVEEIEEMELLTDSDFWKG